MRPAFSVVFLTTLIGAGQGLFLALYSAEVMGALGRIAPPGPRFLHAGSWFAALLAGLGLLASFFHLGRPERAWRSAARWRTSWLAREVIALPLFIAGVAAYGLAHRLPLGPPLAVGAFALAACLALFVCTGMIYACIRFLQEWASPLTLANFFLIGTASGFTVATALAAAFEPHVAGFFGRWAIVLTVVALASRAISLARNARLRPRSTPQSAIGVEGARVEQKSMGFLGGSFNTREFFHGVSRGGLSVVKWAFIVLGFLVPMALLAAGLAAGSVALLVAAPVVQYAGLVAERWFFLAQSNHPQNLYYQRTA
ncbi:MAG TPA: DmsC/YnfH family molybdoenzyme membrane anchor subunit [Usitatibacter sp.]|nr:DmsC/YnfH family molybdoenzyme membrane anchor subunit [Usitatibacter sp.]